MYLSSARVQKPAPFAQQKMVGLPAVFSLSETHRHVLNRQDIEQAQQLVYQHMLPTPSLQWPLLCQALGCEVWVKHENHTPIGAFKVRGGLVYLQEMQAAGDKRDIVTATRGNHGQSIPYAARKLGYSVHVFVPEGNSPDKNAAMQAWGASLYEQGRDFDAAAAAAAAHAEAIGAHSVPSFHPHLVRGVATYGAELFSAVTDLDAIFVPIGMGSGAASLVSVRNAFGHKTDIVGVVSTEADAFAQSIKAGQICHTDTALTFADGIATRMPHPEAFSILSSGLADVVCVSDDEIAEAMRLLFRTTHNVAEGAGAAATAALMQCRDKYRGKRVAVILSGGNIDADVFTRVLSGSTPSVV